MRAERRGYTWWKGQYRWTGNTPGRGQDSVYREPFIEKSELGNREAHLEGQDSGDRKPSMQGQGRRNLNYRGHCREEKGNREVSMEGARQLDREPSMQGRRLEE